MKTYSGRSRPSFAVLGVLLGGLVAAGIAYATIPDSGSHLYHACMLKNVGTIRMIDPSLPASNLMSHCTSLETPITWNQTGSPGPQGPPGTLPGPQSVNVNCGAGQTIAQALSNATGTPLTVTISGTCREMVLITRDDVTLQGGPSGAGIQAPPGAGGQALVVVDGARDVVVQNLTLTAPAGIGGLFADNGSGLQARSLHVTGGNDAVSVNHGSRAGLDSLTIDGAAQNGLAVGGASSVSMGNSTISGSGANGVVASGSAAVELYGTVVTGSISAGTFGSAGISAHDNASIGTNNVTVENTAGRGVSVFNGGTVNLGTGTVVQGNDQGGVDAMAGHVNLQGAVVQDNGYGLPGGPAAVSAEWGSTLVLQGSTVIEGNAGAGVDLHTGSSATVHASTIIRDNGKDGIHLGDTSVASLENGIQITGNANWGVFCEGAPAVAMITGTMPPAGGNGSGEISCPA